jgi:GT2 family glycosyltransferase
MSSLRISVVIPVHNGGDKFNRCLASLAEVKADFHELIVVADGESDESWLLAEQWGAKVIRLPQTGGPARARNVGADAAQSDILFFIDADVCVHADTVRQVAIAFQQDDQLAALIGSYDDAPGAGNFLSQYRNLLHHYTHQTARAQASTFWGACGAIRRDVFSKIGGFDERYRRPSIEDIELGHRLTAAGYQIRLYKDIQVKHLKCWRARSLLRADFFYRALPWTELILRNQGLINDLNLKISSRISVMLIYGMMGLTMLGLFKGATQTAIAPPFWMIFGLIFLILLQINLPVYRFFLRKRGWWFTVQVVPWHWLYYLYSGLAFAIGWIRHQHMQIFQKKVSVPS